MQQGDKYTQVFKVTPEVYRVFLEVFNDRNLLHTDGAYAQSKGFKGPVMHGNILNGFVSYFIGECLPFRDVVIHTQSIKYTSPVYLDDSLDFNAEITGVFESVRAYEFKYYFSNAGKKVASGTFQIGLL